MKKIIKRLPLIGPIAIAINKKLNPTHNYFPGSKNYWETRYKEGGNSGAGSYSRLAEFKADVINRFVKKNQIKTVIEYGCGDGNQLTLLNYPEYLGFDVSPTALLKCEALFEHDNTKTFKAVDAYSGETAELTLSLDVIYHLIEDQVFEAYMRRLFDSSSKFVIVYASNTSDHNTDASAPHVKHRAFTEWVKKIYPRWELVDHIPNKYPYLESDPDNTSFADFFIYEKR